jgi:hypothetical protein
VEAVGERWDQVPELVRGRGEAAEQQQLWAARVAGLPVEDVQPLNLRRTVADHDVAPFGLVSRAILGPRPGGGGSYVVERTSGPTTQTGS